MPKTLQFKSDDQDIFQILKTALPFEKLSDDEIRMLIPLLTKYEYEAGEIVISEGETGTSAFIVSKGEFCFEKMGRMVKTFTRGDFFGEVALIDDRPRTGSVRALTKGHIFSFEGKDLDDEKKIPSKTAVRIYRGFSRLVTTYVREGSTLYREMDVLLIQDGGCAPGYNPITAFLSEYLEKAGYKVFIAAEGFKSVVSGKTEDYRCLIYHRDLYDQLDHIPGVMFSPPLRESRGANFRAERFPDFKKEEIQKIAAQNIQDRKVKTVIGIGGNGTFAGINALSRLLPVEIQTFFVPVTIDSDIYGTDCIGEFTGVEVGAEKIRCYMADARTHRRCYIIEMMGAQGGYHALHSALGAGAHLAVLPSSRYDMKKIVKAINPRSETVIVVAEGYKRDDRRAEGYTGNAAEYFRDELTAAGLNTSQKVICEGFSRDIRGASPNNLDIMLAQRMARNLSRLISAKKTRLMPAVLSGKEYSISFDDIETDNSVKSELASLANRLFS